QTGAAPKTLSLNSAARIDPIHRSVFASALGKAPREQRPQFVDDWRSPWHGCDAFRSPRTDSAEARQMSALPSRRLSPVWQHPLVLVRPETRSQYWTPRRVFPWRPRYSELQVEDLGHIVVARFTCRAILSGHTADVLGKQLSSLVRPGGH